MSKQLVQIIRNSHQSQPCLGGPDQKVWGPYQRFAICSWAVSSATQACHTDTFEKSKASKKSEPLAFGHSTPRALQKVRDVKGAPQPCKRALSPSLPECLQGNYEYKDQKLNWPNSPWQWSAIHSRTVPSWLTSQACHAIALDQSSVWKECNNMCANCRFLDSQHHEHCKRFET